MDFIQQNLIDPVSHVLWTYVLVYLLTAAGLYFTIRTRFVQVRLFPRMLAALRGSREGGGDSVSSFQAFCVGLGSRVGTGNIAGVAIAVVLGGPGAIFWMWCLGLLGMSTAFVEATLAQLFKVSWPDGSFRGGPAFYIRSGLRSKAGGALFAVLLIFTFGIAFNMVQANAISDVLYSAHTIDMRWTAIALMLLVAPVLFGGVRRVAKVAELIVPAMAVLYMVLAIVIVAMNITKLPGVIGEIVESAFGVRATLAGTEGGLAAALLNGAKRGLFSNEAGMGSAPNAAAAATTSHPANQGLIQSLGVFVDTMVVCSSTGFIILISDHVYHAGQGATLEGAALTQAAIVTQFGTWSRYLMTVLIVVFAFSSILGNYSYAEINIDFLGGRSAALTVFRVVALAAVGLGAVLALGLVWDFADVSMGLMALVNLTAIVLLGRWAFGVLRDYESGKDGFVATGNPALPAELPGDVWAAPPGAPSVPGPRVPPGLPGQRPVLSGGDVAEPGGKPPGDRPAQ